MEDAEAAADLLARLGIEPKSIVLQQISSNSQVAESNQYSPRSAPLQAPYLAYLRLDHHDQQQPPASLLLPTSYVYAGLSHREITVLGAWLCCDSKTDVGARLGIALGTVNTHLTRIRNKYSAVGRPPPPKSRSSPVRYKTALWRSTTFDERAMIGAGVAL